MVGVGAVKNVVAPPFLIQGCAGGNDCEIELVASVIGIEPSVVDALFASSQVAKSLPAGVLVSTSNRPDPVAVPDVQLARSLHAACGELFIHV